MHARTHARIHMHARAHATRAYARIGSIESGRCDAHHSADRPMRSLTVGRGLTADSISEAVRLSSRHRRSRAARACRPVHHISSLTVEIRRIGTMHAMNVMRARLTAACLRASHACRDEALDRAEARTFNITVATLFGGDDVPPHIRPHEGGARITKERIHDGGLG